MAKRANFGYQKRQKEIKREKKKADKAAKREAKREAANATEQPDVTLDADGQAVAYHSVPLDPDQRNGID